MDHPAALHRLTIGVPATVEHSSEATEGGSEIAKWVAETTSVSVLCTKFEDENWQFSRLSHSWMPLNWISELKINYILSLQNWCLVTRDSREVRNGKEEQRFCTGTSTRLPCISFGRPSLMTGWSRWTLWKLVMRSRKNSLDRYVLLIWWMVR